MSMLYPQLCTGGFVPCKGHSGPQELEASALTGDPYVSDLPVIGGFPAYSRIVNRIVCRRHAEICVPDRVLPAHIRGSPAVVWLRDDLLIVDVTFMPRCNLFCAAQIQYLHWVSIAVS